MWHIAGKQLSSRFFLGTAQYPSLSILQAAIHAAETEVVTISLKRELSHGTSKNLFWETIKSLGCHLLPNTAGCHTAAEAITLAKMAREIFQTDWIKLEVIGDDYNLQPNPFELIEAASHLIADGFQVFPYCTDDLVVCKKLIEGGCRILMPWAAPIGSARGLTDSYHLKNLRQRFPDVQMIIDAGIGKPSHAAHALELGFDGVLLNSAVALANDPTKMACAFKEAIRAGRLGYEAGLLIERDAALSTTLLIDTPFWQQVSL